MMIMGNFKDLVIPTIDVNDDKVTIADIQKENLEWIDAGEKLYTVETSKAATDYIVDFSGYVVLYVEDLDEVRVGESVGMIFENLEDAKLKLEEIKVKKEKAEKTASVNASKKALAYAEQIGFDITRIRKDGMIKTGDIDNFIKENGK